MALTNTILKKDFIKMTTENITELRKSLDYFINEFYNDLRVDSPKEFSSKTFTFIARKYDELSSHQDKNEPYSAELLKFIFETVNFLCGRIRESDFNTMGTTKLLLSSLGESFDYSFDEMGFRLDAIEKEQKEITRNQYQIMNYLEVLYKKINEIN